MSAMPASRNMIRREEDGYDYVQANSHILTVRKSFLRGFLVTMSMPIFIVHHRRRARACCLLNFEGIIVFNYSEAATHQILYNLPVMLCLQSSCRSAIFAGDR
jgi:hypothetical protein